MKSKRKPSAWPARARLTAVGLASVLIVLTTLGCGGEAGREGPESQVAEEVPSAGAVAAAVAPSGPIDTELASRGAELFTARGCAGCHTIGGGRLTGPDLGGITERREYGWTIAMITRPDSMIKNDEIARRLFAEYMTPMLNVGVTNEEARAMYEFLRREDGGS